MGESDYLDPGPSKKEKPCRSGGGWTGYDSSPQQGHPLLQGLTASSGIWESVCTTLASRMPSAWGGEEMGTPHLIWASREAS